MIKGVNAGWLCFVTNKILKFVDRKSKISNNFGNDTGNDTEIISEKLQVLLCPQKDVP